MTSKILRLDASANVSGSSSRKLGDQLIAELSRRSEVNIQYRDLNRGLNFIDETWVGANFTPLDERSSAQESALEFSDQLIEELRQADHIVLTTPMYNFGVPASLKAWIDLVCRAGVTFQYTSDGPVGLLKNKRIDIIITTGGVPLQSSADFVSDYLGQVFRFIGIEQINVIAADQMNIDTEASFNRALAQIEQQIAA